MQRVVPHAVFGLTLLLVLAATAISWRATDQASTQELGPMADAILTWVWGRSGVGAVAIVGAVVASAVPSPTPVDRSALGFGLGSVVAALAGVAVAPAIAASVGACAAGLLLLVWLRGGHMVALPLGVAGAALLAVSYVLPYTTGEPIPPLAAPFLAVAVASAGCAALAASRRNMLTVSAVWLGAVLLGMQPHPWPAPDAQPSIELPAVEASEALVVKDVGQHHAVILQVDGTTSGLPVPANRTRDVRLDVDRATLGAQALPVLHALRADGVDRLAIRLAHPPTDPSIPDRELAILGAALDAERGERFVLTVHPELGLNGRAMPKDKAESELRRGLRPRIRKDVRIVVAPEASWEQVVAAIALARRAGAATALLVGAP